MNNKEKKSIIDNKLIIKKYKELLLIMIILYLSLIVTIAIFAITFSSNSNKCTCDNCLNNNDSLDPSLIADEVISRLSIKDLNGKISSEVTKYEYVKNKQGYVFEGTLINNTDKNYYDIEYTYELYNKDGKLIDELNDSIDEIKAHEKVKISQISTANYIGEVGNYKLISINGLDKKIE